jgi:hypothetical protein
MTKIPRVPKHAKGTRRVREWTNDPVTFTTLFPGIHDTVRIPVKRERPTPIRNFRENFPKQTQRVFSTNAKEERNLQLSVLFIFIAVMLVILHFYV